MRDTIHGRASNHAFKGPTHLWGQVATLVATPQATYQSFVPINTALDACDHGLWQITTTAVEYMRSSGDGLNPLPDAAYSDPLVAGAFANNRTTRTQIKIRVRADDGVGLRQFAMDANQSLCIVAKRLCVDWLVPPGTRDVTNLDTSGSSFELTEWVLDSFVGVSLTRAESPPGNANTATLTTHQFVTGTTVANIQIPDYATEVTVYQTSAGSAATTWQQHYGNPAVASFEIGMLPFTGGARRTQPLQLLPDASFLRTDTDAADRFFTLVWSIRP